MLVTVVLVTVVLVTVVLVTVVLVSHRTTLCCADQPELSNWRELPHLRLLNLVYDLTPASLVSIALECAALYSLRSG